MFIRAVAAFLLLPEVVGFVMPLLIARFDPWRGHDSLAGILDSSTVS